ncbi:hypothetical protein [Pseudonocardia humida]|uniref:Uncharacterized protein n=1 Tax=Pseudonocardia humida TaxID=2800819 RepID=A0ABT1A8J5_9PSEU|nr:hypothetical protein [Pseudonocardia humida]MCO1659238.1 hypothetical protein [Pseudonocardia humida]
MHWILTGMLIVASLATAVYTGYLMRRLFTLEPGVPDVADAAEVQPAPSEPAPSQAAPAEPAAAQPAAAQEKA